MNQSNSICQSYDPIATWRTVLLDSVSESYEDDAEEEKLPVLRAQGVTPEDYDTTDDEYGNEHDVGHREGYDDW